MAKAGRGGNKGIYFLPSLFTTAGLFFGFYAIIQATLGNFERAAVGLLVAMIMDGLDGRVARWTNTASDFGKEYDSLVDVIAFGLAPALVMYFWSLQSIGKAGWLIAFLFTAAAALRLARFNTLTIKDSRYFYGIPCPSAAAFVVFWVWNFHASGIDGRAAPMAWSSAVATVLLAVLMVSNLRFRSFKDFDLINRIPFAILIAFAVIFVLVFFDPPRALFLLALAYVISGPAGWLLRWQRGTSESPAFLPDGGEEEPARRGKWPGKKRRGKGGMAAKMTKKARAGGGKSPRKKA
ncbi:MAG: CDP-diacylglycerol--serine O-phosphatidyltransferase [Gammaproteobacteria bacterium]|nr:CDP-diacylglycerol--serine O-phosphatidyltransferase [Gammaproteobacteria bacterium]